MTYSVLGFIACCGLWPVVSIIHCGLLCIIDHANTFDQLNIHHLRSVLFCVLLVVTITITLHV